MLSGQKKTPKNQNSREDFVTIPSNLRGQRGLSFQLILLEETPDMGMGVTERRREGGWE